MRIKKFLLLTSVLLLSLTGCKKAGSADIPANPIEKEGYELVFADEFDEDEIDIKKWLPQYFPHATATAAGCQTTYRIEDGSLCLYIDETTPNYADYTEMKVSSIQTLEKNLLHPGAAETNITNVVSYETFTCQYGYFEMRAKLPNCGGGGHVAWWLIGAQDDAREDGTMSSQDGEIDILETTFEYTNVFSPKVHAWNDKDLSEFQQDVGLEGNYSDSYHIYAMDWTPSGLTFYVDGEEIAATTNSPQYRMAMLLGIYTDCIDFTGAANDVYPKEFYIDYVRVYQDKDGYPDGTTKDTTPVVLEKDLATQYEAKSFGDTERAQTQTNYLSTATMFLNEETAEFAGLCDGDYTNGYVSPDGVALPEEYTFTWDSAISADTLRVVTHYALGQAPTYFEIQTKTANEDWKSVDNCNVSWIASSESHEYVDIKLDASKITGLKLIIKEANLEWKHYVISELKLFTERDVELENAKKLISTIINGSEILETNLSYMAETITSTGKGKGIHDLANEDRVAGYVSEDNPLLPQDIVFTFDELQTVSGIRLTGNCSLGQAPTLVEVSVKIAGSYKSLGDYFLAWQTKDEVYEYCDLIFNTQSKVEAVKITVKRANLEWKHYAIQELQIY